MHEITSNPDLLLDSLDGHLYETDTSVKWTSRIGPSFPILPFLTLYKTDTTLRQPLRVGTKGVHLKESWLYSEKFDDGQTATNINTKYKWASQGNVPHWVEEFLDCLQHSLWICFQTDTRVGGGGGGGGGVGITARDLLYCEWFFYKCLLATARWKSKGSSSSVISRPGVVIQPTTTTFIWERGIELGPNSAQSKSHPFEP